jgi:branched-chain amino acid transport system permease protein
MSAACGVNQTRLFTTVYALASGLAGLAGVLAVPISGASLEMDVSTVVNALVVVVVGGMGSVLGSMLAAILIGLVNAFGILVLPQFEMTFVYALMALVLIIRPTGLFGRE